MQIVLLVAGIGSLYPLKELGTGLVLLFLTLFNAVLGLRQEGKAAEAVAALQKMMIVKARVRRDGELVQIPAEELVPGRRRVDRGGRRRSGRRPPAVGGDARGRRVGADRREPAGLEGRRGGRDADTPLGDRTDMVFMNTNVTRGTGSVRRHVDGDGDRGRPHLAHAPGGGGVGHAADRPAQEADEPDPVHLGRGRGRVDHRSTCRAARASTPSSPRRSRSRSRRSRPGCRRSSRRSSRTGRRCSRRRTRS